jgi:hypothetical protein
MLPSASRDRGISVVHDTGFIILDLSQAGGLTLQTEKGISIAIPVILLTRQVPEAELRPTCNSMI